jgi:hypothetical protein
MAGPLTNMNSGQFATITDGITHSQTNQITLTNASLKLNIDNKIIMNQGSIFKSYKDIIFGALIDYTMDDKYMYRPDYLALDYWGTTDLWYLLLWINSMSSVHDFTQKNIKILPVNQINLLMNILNKYSNDIQASQKTPLFIPDITITKIQG